MPYFRHPKTQAERRANEAHQCEFGGSVRRAKLPHSRDDIEKSCPRSWKAHRRTQYKQAGRPEKRPSY